MELTRRFLFNGSAAAYGGRFVRPDDVILTSTGGSVLSVVGGRSVWSDRDIRIGKSFRIKQAETSAEGLVDSLRDAIRVTHGKLANDALRATTSVSTRIRGIEVGGAPPVKRGDEPEPTMSVAEVSCTLLSRSADPGHEANVTVQGAFISTVTFDSPVHGKYKLDVNLQFDHFQRADTRAKIIANSAIMQVHGDKDIIFSTIVKDLVWQKDKPYPGSDRIGSNGLYIPNLGRFFFGEFLIQAGARRLTMIRMALGSPTGGDGCVGDVDANGTWSF